MHSHREQLKFTPLTTPRSKYSLKKKGPDTARVRPQYNLHYVSPINIPINKIQMNDIELQSGKNRALSVNENVSFLSNESPLSSPKSIKNFVEQNYSETLINQSANTIKATWKKFRFKIRLNHFLKFVYRQHMGSLHALFHTWRLSSHPLHPESYRSYKIIEAHLKKENLLKFEPLTKKFRFFNGLYFCSYDFYMKTNFIFISPQYDPNIIKKYISIMLRNDARQLFSIWNSFGNYAHVMNKKVERDMRITCDYRLNFQNMFTFFLFWRRYTKLKLILHPKVHKTKVLKINKKNDNSPFHVTSVLDEKANDQAKPQRTRNISSSISQSLVSPLKSFSSSFKEYKTKIEKETGNFFILEWRLYIARKSSFKRYATNATQKYNTSIINLAVIALKRNRQTKTFLRTTGEKVKKIANQYLMSNVYRSFLSAVGETRMKFSKRSRIIKAWYSLIDRKLIDKSTKQIMMKRSELTSLSRLFKYWRKMIEEERIIFAYKTIKIHENPRKLYPFVFLWMNDFNHFAFYSSFLKWSRLIEKRKRIMQFVTFSKEYSFDMKVKRYFFHLFKENAQITTNRVIFQPFCDNILKNRFHNLMEQTVHKPKNLLESINDSNQTAVNLKVVSNFADIIVAMKNISHNKYVKKDPPTKWASTFSHNDVKTLFFNLLMALEFGKQYVYSNKSQAMAIQNLQNFQRDNTLFSAKTTSILISKLIKENEEKRRQLRKILIRDQSILNVNIAHDAALEMQQFFPHFQTNPKPIDISSIIEDGSIEFASGRLPQKGEESIKRTARQKVNHPMLKNIKEVKQKMMNNSRAYRRDPNELENPKTFEGNTSMQSVYSPVRVSKSSLDLSMSKNSAYEKYNPPSKNALQSGMFARSNLDFTISELKAMKEESDKIMKQWKTGEQFPENPSSPSNIVQNIKETNIQLSSLSRSVVNFIHKYNDSTDIFDQPKLNSSKSKDAIDICSTLIPANIEISDFSSHFITDPEFASLGEGGQQGNYLAEKYLAILDLLLENATQIPKPPKIEKRGKPLIKNYLERMRGGITTYLDKLRGKKPTDTSSTLQQKVTTPKSPRTVKKTAKNISVPNSHLKKSKDEAYSKVLFQGRGELVEYLLDFSKPPDFYDYTKPIEEPNIPPLIDTFIDKFQTFVNDNQQPEENHEEKEDLEEPEKEKVDHRERLINTLNEIAKQSIQYELGQESEQSYLNSEIVNYDLVDQYQESEIQEQPIEPVQEEPKEQPAPETSPYDKFNRKSEPKIRNSQIPLKIVKAISKSGNILLNSSNEIKEKEKEVIVLKQKLSFSKSLFHAINESSKLIHPYIFKYYDNPSQIPAVSNQFKAKFAQKLQSIAAKKQKEARDHQKEKEKQKKIEQEERKEMKEIQKKNKGKDQVLYAHEIPLKVQGNSHAQHASKDTKPLLTTPIDSGRRAKTAHAKSRSKYGYPITDSPVPPTQRSRIPKDFKNDINIGHRQNISFDLNNTQTPNFDKTEKKSLPLSCLRPKSAIKTQPTPPPEPPVFFFESDAPENPVKKEHKTKPTIPASQMKWNLEWNYSITDEDIDYFLFVSPYVMPMEILEEIINNNEPSDQE